VTRPDGPKQDDAALEHTAVPDPAAVAGRERLSEQIKRTGMFGASGTGDTSGYGGLQVRRAPRLSSPRPYGSYFDEVADTLAGSLATVGVSFGEAVEQVVVASGQLTLYVRREHLAVVALVDIERQGLISSS